MEMLKELSKSILIILVSHNKKLVDKYSDRIITLKDGEVVDDKSIQTNVANFNISKKYKYSSKWTNIFTKKNLKINFKKNIFSIISCMVGFAAIFLSFGFYNGSQKSQENALRNNLAIMHATISEKTFFEIENSPLSYEKSVRPSLIAIEQNLDDFSECHIEPNLSYLFPTYPYGSYNSNPIENFQLIPLYDVSLETYGSQLLASGAPPNETIEEVIVNEEFVKLIGSTNENVIDDLFNISYSTSISFPTGDYENPMISDDYSFNYDLRICGVVKEFSFLNTPKIYYSYKALKKELDTWYLENISEYLGSPITYLNYIEDSKEDDVVSSYSYDLFLDSINEAKPLFEKIKQLNDKESSLQIDSNAYEIQQSYKTFIESFSTALFIFVIIAFIGVNFILGMISLSTFIENKKNSAILICLGARNSSIQSIYLSENYLIILVSMILSIFVAIVSQTLLNNVIATKFALYNLIDIPFYRYLNVPFGLIIGLIAIAIIFSTIFTLTPMIIYRKMSLSEELRDE